MPLVDQTPFLNSPYAAPEFREERGYAGEFPKDLSTIEVAVSSRALTPMSPEVARAAKLGYYLDWFALRVEDATPFDANVSPWNDETRVRASGGAHAAQAVTPEAADSIQLVRANLVNRKFSGAGISAEYEARLKLLTERMRRLDPAVTADGLSGIEHVVTVLESAKATRDAAMILLDS